LNHVTCCQDKDEEAKNQTQLGNISVMGRRLEIYQASAESMARLDIRRKIRKPIRLPVAQFCVVSFLLF
jgi:hypothetical protein